MTFAQPLMLLGALAALIPLLIHLFDRRRPRPHPFGAISFVLKSQRRTASRLKLKRLILYALRTLILLALPIALARPEWRKEALPGASARGPAATAIVLDASLSMRWADGTSLFAEAQEEARDALAGLSAEEPATVLLCGLHARPPLAAGFDRARLRSLIDQAQPSHGSADLTRCLDLAAHALEESPLPAKRLVVVSDFTAHSLRLEAPPPLVKGPTGEPVRPEMVLVDAARGRPELPNHAIVDLKIEPAMQVGPRAFQFTFTVRNFSSLPVKDLEASLRVQGQVVAKGFLDLAPGGTSQKVLTHRFDEGGTVSGEVAIASDQLAEDDRRPFVLAVPKELTALVVNGSPSTVRLRDETFFVEAALTAPGSPVRAFVRDAEAGLREDLSQYDVVMLLNVPLPTEEQAQGLAALVEKGGGLFLSMGDNVVDVPLYSARLASVLPRPLRDTKTAVDPEAPDVTARAAKLASVSTEHPVFSVFTGPAREGLLSARFYRYVLLEGEQVTAGQKATSQVLATFDDGAPAFAVAKKGPGRVMLFTSTVDRDWSDFAIRTAFLPFLQRVCAYLTGSLEERDELRAQVGEVVTFRPSSEHKPTAAKGPQGEELKLDAQPDGSFQLGPVETPGAYTVLDGKGQALPALFFAVTLDPSESDLSRIKPEVLSAYFGEEMVRTAGGPEPERKVPLWTWLILLAACAFFFEGLLLRR
ncbi:MAG: BatA domain-containing protein [Myxococcota bacterium]